MPPKCLFVDADCVFNEQPQDPTWCQVCTSMKYQKVMKRVYRASEIQILFTLWTALPHEETLQHEAGKKLKKMVGELMDDVEDDDKRWFECN